ncbi:winged helix-turn-helix transcriptional regulator [Nonomuraea basaltis]|nr:winged helix-turn-helix transcriptional regulator [Nonomuraea basaltis]
MAFSADDLAQMRFAVSPMWEVVTSYQLVMSGSAHPVHRRWLERVCPQVAAAGLDRGWLAKLIRPGQYCPDFLTPTPGGPAPDLADELAAVRATSPGRVHQDLDLLRRKEGHLGPRLRSLYADPPSCLPRIAEEIETYWELALAPYWARIQTVLDADVYHRARQVAEHGAGHLFNDLHASMSWDGNSLQLIRRRTLARESTGPGLLLIPSVFIGAGLLSRETPPDPPQFGYQARGVGTLWQPRPVARTGALAAVLGRSRTRLLIELESPASTTELARRTGLSAAGASRYLTAMRDAGLVSAHRSGRSVLYARTAAAEAVLAAAGQQTQDA